MVPGKDLTFSRILVVHFLPLVCIRQRYSGGNESAISESASALLIFKCMKTPHKQQNRYSDGEFGQRINENLCSCSCDGVEKVADGVRWRGIVRVLISIPRITPRPLFFINLSDKSMLEDESRAMFGD